MKAGLYCRLSEEDRDKQSEDSNSIQNQKALLTEYAEQQGWQIYQVYSDDDYTGADRKRPAFLKLLEDAKAHKFEIVLCKSQARFTRELELVEKYIHGWFPLWGIRFVSIADHADTANQGNKKSRQINGLVNEWYLEDMSDNIKVVLENRRKQGFHIGAFALYGYKKDPAQKGHLLIDEEAAEIVKEVFTLYARGYGKTAIARLLNDRGIPNPTEYKRLHGLKYQPPTRSNSMLWRYAAISSMLSNEIYRGHMVQGKYGSVSYKTKQNRPRPKAQWYRVEHTHEAIIEETLWNRVQALLAQKTKPFASGSIGLFAYKARCAYCGYVLRSSKSHGKYYLKCPNHALAKDACTGAFIAVDTMAQSVLTELNRLAAQYLNLDVLAREIVQEHDGRRQKDILQAEISHYEREAALCKKGLQELYMDKVRGLLAEADFLELAERLSRERERLAACIHKSVAQKEALEANLQTMQQRQDIAAQYTNLTSLNRETVEIMVEYITVGRRDAETGEVPVEVHWNF